MIDMAYGQIPEHLRKVAQTRNGKLISTMMEGIAPVMAEYVAAEIEKATAPLKAEIAALKARKYEGVWQSERSYPEGAMVTHSGSMWHANKNSRRKSLGLRPTGP